MEHILINFNGAQREDTIRETGRFGLAGISVKSIIESSERGLFDQTPNEDWADKKNLRLMS